MGEQESVARSAYTSAMAFDTRFQLIDRRATAGLVQALVQGRPPVAGPLDRNPEALALWTRAAAAVRSGDAMTAARAVCWVAVVWNAAVLPAIVLRNVALTHRPLRMPDRLAVGLDLPTASPRDWIASAGVPAPVLAALPTRLDAGSETGAFFDPSHAGPVLARAIAAASLAPDERLVLARLLSVLRAGERADLSVWESMDTGPIVAAPEGATTSLCWPGLDRPLLAAALTEEEWARLEGAAPWPLAHGDLEDLLVATCWVAPDDRARVPRASRVLSRAFRAGASAFVDDLLPRAFAWLTAVMAVPELASASVIAYAHLEGSATNRITPQPVPPAVMMRAAEVADAEDMSALTRFFDARGAEGRAALEVLARRQARRAPEASPEQLADGLRALFASYYRGDIPPDVAESIATRWYALFRAAPSLARNRNLTDYVLTDTTPCALLLQRLEGAPSPELACFVYDIMSLAFDDDEVEGPYQKTVRARWSWIVEVTRAGHSALREIDRRLLDTHLAHALSRAIEHDLEEGGASVPPGVAARVAEQWQKLHRFAPDRAVGFLYASIQDGGPYALLLDRLSTEAPSVPLGRLVGEILDGIRLAVDETLEREQLAPFVESVRRNRAFLAQLAGAVREGGEPDLAETIERCTAALAA
ncbi:Hypothetical protein A7982_11933 [Minicystis rosea]|nr:Hypothetical protein A7982_11933 [Minicystis rosea]